MFDLFGRGSPRPSGGPKGGRRLCILHCGQPKTGTTSLQQFLARNRRALSRAGLLYARTDSAPKTGEKHGGVLRRITGVKLPRKGGSPEDLRRELDRSSEPVVLLSGEEIYPILLRRRDPSIPAFFAEAGFDLHLLTYLRDQPALLNSSYVERTKFGRERLSFAEDIDRVLDKGAGQGIGGSRALPAADLDLPGVTGMTFRPYGPEVLKNGLETDFLETVFRIGAERGLTGSAADLSLTPVPRTNVSEGPFIVAAGRRIARDLIWRHEEAWKRLFVSGPVHGTLAGVFRDMGLPASRYTGLTPERFDRIRAAYRPENDIFARRHWGCDWETAFPAPAADRLVSNDLDDCPDPELHRAFETFYEAALPQVTRRVAEVEKRAETVRRR